METARNALASYQRDFPKSCTPSDKHFEWRTDKRQPTIFADLISAGMYYTLVCDYDPRFEHNCHAIGVAAAALCLARALLTSRPLGLLGNDLSNGCPGSCGRSI